MHSKLFDDLSIDTSRLIEDVCTRFESEFAKCHDQSRSQLIEAYLVEFVGPVRVAALQELIGLDIELRSSLEIPTLVEDYQDFSQASDVDVALLAYSTVVNRKSNPPEADQLTALSQRYRFEKLIGSGGIARVWRVIDTYSLRPMAFKLLHESLVRFPILAARLLREANITGLLQHPGIPPVFEYGELTVGRAYFVMKLVSGKTLGEILKDQQGNAEVAALLDIFEQVTQTVAFAHNNGVIHRDLKPQNLMVGEFLEVQVMDWGMAKVLPGSSLFERISSSNQLAAPLSSLEQLLNFTECDGQIRPLKLNSRDTPQQLGRDVETQAGQVLGTPAYMSPEQARGEVEQLTAASDVFSLGCILYELLTRKRLYQSSANSSVLVQAVAGNVAQARAELEDLCCEPQLRAICLRCLEYKPIDRYSTALELFEAVRDYRQSVDARLRQAEIDKHTLEVRADEERKRRRVTLRLSFIAISILAMSALGIGWQWREAVKARIDADGKKQLAHERLMKAKTTVDDYLVAVANSKELKVDTPGTQTLRRDLLTMARSFYTDFVEENPNDFQSQIDAARTFVSLAKIDEELNLFAEEIEYTNQAIAIYERLMAVNHEVRLVRDELAFVLKKRGESLIMSGKHEAGIQDLEKDLELCRLAHIDNPDDLASGMSYATSLTQLSSLISDRQREDSLLKEALLVERDLLKNHPETVDLRYRYAFTLGRLASSQIDRAQFEMARDSASEALEIYGSLNSNGTVASLADVAIARRALGTAYGKLGEYEKALEIRQKAVRDSDEWREREPLSALWRGQLVQDLQLLLETQVAAGEIDAAVATLDKCIPEASQNVVDFPDNKYLLLRLSDLYHKQAKTLQASSAATDTTAILQAFENSLLSHRELHKVGSLGQIGVIENYVRLCRDYGNYAWKVRQADRSVEVMREGLAIDEELIKAEPKLGLGRLSNQFRLDLAKKLQAIGQFELAAERYQTIESTLKQELDAPFLLGLLRIANLNGLGSCYLESCDYENALEAFQNGQSLLDGLAKQESTLKNDEQTVAMVQAELADAELGKLQSLILLERMDQARNLISELTQQPQVNKLFQIRLLWCQAALDQNAELIFSDCKDLCSEELTSFERYTAAAVAAVLANRDVTLNLNRDEDSREAKNEKYSAASAEWLEQAVAQDDTTDFHVRIPRLLDHPSFKALKATELFQRALAY